MHYAEFAEDEVSRMNSCSSYRVDRILADKRVLSLRVDVQSAALLAAIKEYEASKWKVIGAKVGKPAKVGKDAVLCLLQRHCSSFIVSPLPFIPFLSPEDETSGYRWRVGGSHSGANKQ